MTTELYRKSAKKQHKTLACYLSLWAWINKVDCVVVKADAIFRFLGVEKMRSSRIKWITQDVKRFFPYVDELYCTQTRGYQSVYLSRLPFPAGFAKKSMTTQKHVNVLNRKGLRTKVARLRQEKKMVALLAAVTHGVGDFD
jgi:hypothetical protein